MSSRNSMFEAISALLIYTDGKEYYVEQSRITNQSWLSGWRPVNENFIREVFTHFKADIKKIDFGGYVPPGVVAFADNIQRNTVAWRTPEQDVNLMFSKGMHIPDGKYRVPGLLWIFSDSLDIYAYKEWDEQETALYLPPFHNCTQENVCLGSASSYLRKKKARYTFEEVIKDVETTFWKSEFTHAGGGSGNIDGNFVALFEKTNREHNMPDYPYEYLKSANKTVKQVIDEISNP